MNVEEFLHNEEKMGEPFIIARKNQQCYAEELKCIETLLRVFCVKMDLAHIKMCLYLKKRRRYIRKIIRRNEEHYQKEVARISLIHLMQEEISGQNV